MTLCTANWLPLKNDWDAPSFVSKVSASGTRSRLTSTSMDGKRSSVTGADGGKSLTALARGES